jgi:cellulose synthase/poly-beta-1,6-N-acetylglucosamine synthase-like glycosyltransferase
LELAKEKKQSDRMKEKIGIRSKNDLTLFLFLVAITTLTITFMFLPLVLNFDIARYADVYVDVSSLTFVVTILMTIVGFVWMSYGVLGLILKPRAPISNTYDGKFSILVPAKDEEKVIGNLLRDLQKQTYSDFEVIVICHNCKDNTYRTVKNLNDSRIKPLKLAGRPGKSVALNYGAQAAEGEILVVFDADNRVPEDFLAKVRLYFPEYDAVQSRIETGNAEFNLLTKLAELEFISFTDLFQRTRSALGMNVGLGGTGEVIKKRVMHEVGWWDEWSLTEDFALFIKLTNHKCKIGWAYDTYVMDEKVPWWSDFFRQRARWMRGHYQVASKYWKSFCDKPVDFHYLIAPFSILGYYFTFGLWLLFFIGTPISTAFLPPWLWLVPWLVWNFSIAVRIAKRKGVKSLAYFPLLFFYLYHWIAIFPYIFRVRSWTKTPHGFTSN